MRMITKAMFAAAIPAIAIAAPAQAQVGGGQMNGVVQPVCEVDDVFASVSFPAMVTGAEINDDVLLQCNDADGATVSLISSEGGMESDDFEDLEIEYTATLTSGAIDGGVLTLDLPLGTQGDNDATATANASGSAALAAGVLGNLNVTLKEDGIYAGGYSDTITIQLTAS